MFGLGMGELLLILVVALLAVGPDKLPGAARSIGKAIRDLRRQTKELQTTLEQDTKLGDAVRELKSALHDDPLRAPRPARPAAPAARPPDAQPDPRTHKTEARPVTPPNTIPQQPAAREPTPAVPSPLPKSAAEPPPIPKPKTKTKPPTGEPDSSAHG